jgi:hypothetical protein
MHDHRAAFEERAFNLYFIKSIERNPKPPRGTGAMDFISTATMTKAELCKRQEDGEYVDAVLQQLWAGWQMALCGLHGETSPEVGAQVAYELIAERTHQRRRFSEEKDDLTSGELAMAAAGYALQAARGSRDEPLWWPGTVLPWHPRDPYRNLVRAGALVMAELERMTRAASERGPDRRGAGSIPPLGERTVREGDRRE